MPDWDKILAQVAVVTSAPLPFFVAVLIAAGLIWLAMDWRYNAIITGREGIIANKDSEITLLKGQRDDYKDKLSGATPDQAKARIDDLEGRLARLEPRRLTPAQRENLAMRLRVPTGSNYLIAISRDMACSDCAQLGADFSAAFGAASGWQITNPMLGGIATMPPSGIAIKCADIVNPSAEAKLVIDAMKAVGIQFDLQVAPPSSRPAGFPQVSPVEIVLTNQTAR
jgi:hypothetical protein